MHHIFFSRKEIRWAKGTVEIMNLTLVKMISETIDVYRRVCFRTLTFEACARHFMYYSGRGGFVCVFRPAFFFSTYDGGVYGFIIRPIPSARPRIHVHARNRCTSGVMIRRVCWKSVRCESDACEILPFGTTSVYLPRACGTIKKYPSGVKINLTLGRAETNRPSGLP